MLIILCNHCGKRSNDNEDRIQILNTPVSLCADCRKLLTDFLTPPLPTPPVPVGMEPEPEPSLELKQLRRLAAAVEDLRNANNSSSSERQATAYTQVLRDLCAWQNNAPDPDPATYTPADRLAGIDRHLAEYLKNRGWKFLPTKYGWVKDVHRFGLINAFNYQHECDEAAKEQG